jgi:hypothetical protein
MELAAIIIAILGGISAVLGTLTILQVPAEPIFSAKLTWPFWMALAVILLLISIILMMGRKQNYD